MIQKQTEQSIPKLIKKAIKLTVEETRISQDTLAHIADRVNRVSTIGIGSQVGVNHIFTFDNEVDQDSLFSLLFEFNSQLYLLGIQHEFLENLTIYLNKIIAGLIDNKDVLNVYQWRYRKNDNGSGYTGNILGSLVLLKLYSNTFSKCILNLKSF